MVRSRQAASRDRMHISIESTGGSGHGLCSLPVGDTNKDRTEDSRQEGSSADEATSEAMHGGGDGGGMLAEDTRGCP